jgi:hypothetical protein
LGYAQRYDLSMPSLKPLELAEHVAIGEFVRESYVVKARCMCGHDRELGNLFIRRVIGIQTTIGALQRRLRCHKCGRHEATVDVYPVSPDEPLINV